MVNRSTVDLQSSVLALCYDCPRIEEEKLQMKFFSYEYKYMAIFRYTYGRDVVGSISVKMQVQGIGYYKHFASNTSTKVKQVS